MRYLVFAFEDGTMSWLAGFGEYDTAVEYLNEQRPSGANDLNKYDHIVIIETKDSHTF